MRRLLTFALLLAALTLVACGDDDDGASGDSESPPAAEAPAETPEEPATKEDESAPESGTTVKIADSDFGPMLFDDGDQAIYLFDKETDSRSQCYDDCAEEWPPVLTEGAPQAGAGAKAGLLGTTKRRDGTTQVTYNGHPLYFYAHEDPGQVLCHNVEGFGGLWLVVTPEGEAAPT